MKQIDPQETACVCACLEGATDNFRFLLERHQGAVYRIAWRMTNHAGDAEEIAQESFLKAYKALHRYDGKHAFSTWLYRIVVNTCLDRLRRTRREIVQDQELSADDELTTPYEQQERAECVQNALARLPEAYRMILILKDVEELDYETIAETLRENIPALKIRVLRGREKLREKLEKMYPDWFLRV